MRNKVVEMSQLLFTIVWVMGVLLGGDGHCGTDVSGCIAQPNRQVYYRPYEAIQ